jgi:hypothetical protein
LLAGGSGNAGMRRALKLHPDSLCRAVTHIEVDVVGEGAGSLVLQYVVTGQIGDLRLPPVTAPARTDGLWRHTCFEAFVRASSGAAYYEFNFAPSTQWAAYRFDDYRSGMRIAAEIGAPRIDVQTAPERLTLQAALDLGPLSLTTCCLGLSAVIEEADGRKSHWALAHPPGKPDFHRADGFAYELS